MARFLASLSILDLREHVLHMNKHIFKYWIPKYARNYEFPSARYNERKHRAYGQNTSHGLLVPTWMQCGQLLFVLLVTCWSFKYI